MSSCPGGEGGAHVLACLRADISGGELPRATDVDAWIVAALAHDVLPLMASLYGRYGFVLPADARIARKVAAFRELRACADLRGLTATLNGAGVPWAVVKGPVLSQRFYDPDGLVRGFNDLDVLVRPDDFGDVLELLADHGAVPWDRDWHLMRRNGRSEMSWVLPGGVLLDLHWNLVNLPDQRRRVVFETGGMLARRRTTVIDGDLPIPVLDDLDMIVHLATHACLSGGHRLRWLVDVQRALRRVGPDPLELRDRARLHRAELPVSAFVEHTATWLDPALDRYVGGLASPTWRRWARAWSEAHPPAAWEGGRSSGRWLFESTRDTSAASVIAGLRQGLEILAEKVRSRTGRGPRVHGAQRLHQGRGDNGARATYLEFVRECARTPVRVRR